MMYQSNNEKGTDVLFVCRGNTCRSPMAHYLFQHQSNEEGLELKVDSCGMMFDDMYGMGGKPITPASGAAIESYNPKIKGANTHISKPNTYKLSSSSELILAMTEQIRDEVIDLLVMTEGQDQRDTIERKVFTLKEYTGLPTRNRKGEKDYDIADPYGAGWRSAEPDDEKIPQENRIKKLKNPFFKPQLIYTETVRIKTGPNSFREPYKWEREIIEEDKFRQSFNKHYKSRLNTVTFGRVKDFKVEKRVYEHSRDEIIKNLDILTHYFTEPEFAPTEADISNKIDERKQKREEERLKRELLEQMWEEKRKLREGDVKNASKK